MHLRSSGRVQPRLVYECGCQADCVFGLSTAGGYRAYSLSTVQHCASTGHCAVRQGLRV